MVGTGGRDGCDTRARSQTKLTGARSQLNNLSNTKYVRQSLLGRIGSCERLKQTWLTVIRTRRRAALPAALAKDFWHRDLCDAAVLGAMADRMLLWRQGARRVLCVARQIRARCRSSRVAASGCGRMTLAIQQLPPSAADGTLWTASVLEFRFWQGNRQRTPPCRLDCRGRHSPACPSPHLPLVPTHIRHQGTHRRGHTTDLSLLHTPQ